MSQLASAQAVIGALHRLSTLPSFDRAVIESVLGAQLYPAAVANPEHEVSTAALEEGPFATAELIEPAPYSRLSERRLVLTPAGELLFRDVAGWYGPGTPLHVDGRAEQPLAAIAYVVDGNEIVFTFAIEEGDVRFVTVKRGR